MPYEIVKVSADGYKVCKKGAKPRECYSNKPLPLRRAKRQQRAIYASEGSRARGGQEYTPLDESFGANLEERDMSGMGEAMMEGEGFFGDLAKRAAQGISDFVMKPKGFEESQVKQGWVNRPADMPPLYTLAQMAKACYSGSKEIAGYTILLENPYMIFYLKDNTNLIIVAIRGTEFSDLKDVSADVSIVNNGLQNSSRYKQDLATLQKFQQQYPPSQYKYYGVGHSLSGAILDKFLNAGLIENGVSFNPAVEKQDFARQNNNHRIYMSCDPLYNIMGKFITNGNIEVLPMENPSGKDAGVVDSAKGARTCHSINTILPKMSGRGMDRRGKSGLPYDLEGGGFLDWVKDKATAIFKPNLEQYTNSSKAAIQKVGDKVITKIDIVRKPVQGFVDKAFKILTLGKWDDLKKKYGYEQFFHLAIECELEGGGRVKIEKNDRIDVSLSWGVVANEERLPVPLNGVKVNVNELLDKTRQRVGNAQFFLYDAFGDRNCQSFIRDLLQTIGLYGEREKAFLYQPVDKLAQEIPSFAKKVSKGLTDLGGKVSLVLGKGMDTADNIPPRVAIGSARFSPIVLQHSMIA